MEWRDRITANPNVIGGKPAIRGTRLAVEYMLDLLANGMTISDILQDWPGLAPEDIQACIAYAADAVRLERMITVHPLS